MDNEYTGDPEVINPEVPCLDLSVSTYACMHRLPENIAYQAFALQWSKAVEEEIVEHCKGFNPNREVISQVSGGGSVVKIGDAVVKYGFINCRLEAWNLKYAREIMPSTVVRIPEVFHYFNRGYDGYLIMEYINGKVLSSVEDPDIYLEPMANILRQFEQVKQDRPGPLHKGPALGQLWLDYDPPVLTSISDIEEYYNTRQLKNGPQSMKLHNYPLIFCHLDIAPRNILVLEDGSLCLIDWGTAGFYPRLFERAVLEMNIRGEAHWNTKLLELMGEPDEDEKTQCLLLQHAAYLAVRYN